MLDWVSHSDEETQLLGHTFASYLKPGDVVTLSGDLGAGKTTFAKGLISKITGCHKDEITSPTFTYMQIFSGNGPTVYHFDLYRINNADEFISLGFEEFFQENAICCIEWSERIQTILPSKRVKVMISYLEVGKRSIRVDGV